MTPEWESAFRDWLDAHFAGDAVHGGPTANRKGARMSRKSMAEKIAELKRREAWKLTRKAEKLEAQAAQFRKAASDLEFQAQMEGPSVPK